MQTHKSKFFFDHIPKTAGISLDTAFKGLFPKYRRLSQISNAHLHAWQQPDSDYIGGHIYFYPNEILAPEHYYCSVLRDPVQRFISQYYFNRQVGESLLKQGAIGDSHLSDLQVLTSLRLGLDEYAVQHGPIRRSFSNVQALHFAARLTSHPHDLDDKALEDAAIASLEGYDLVGSFDNLQDFVDAVACDFGIDSVVLSKLNVTRTDPGREKISSQTLATLTQANAVDFKLLHWAKQRFSKTTGPVSPRDLAAPEEMTVITTTDAQTESPKNEFGFGNQLIRILKIRCTGDKAGLNIIANDEAIIIDVDIEATVAENDLTIGIALRDREEKLAYGVNSKLLGIAINIEKPGYYKASIQLENHLGIGAYSVTLALHKGIEHTTGCYHWLDSAATFAVCATNQPFEGYVDCQATISLSDITKHD